MRAVTELAEEGPSRGATVLAVQFDMHALVVTFGYDRAEQVIEAAGRRVRELRGGAAVG